jgi:hypothetical protein
MEVSGMKKDKNIIEEKPKVKISLKILPFGNISYEITNLELPIGEKEPETPRYTEPLTTNTEGVEILYEKSETYLVPKTTAGT